MMNPFIRRTSWGALAILGYILSPLSWWNDLWVNIPIAYAAANLAHLFSAQLFLPAFVTAYWITNILGLILLHAGIRGSATSRFPAVSRNGIFWWLVISLAYTAALGLMVKLGILRPVEAYLAAHP